MYNSWRITLRRRFTTSWSVVVVRWVIPTSQELSKLHRTSKFVVIQVHFESTKVEHWNSWKRLQKKSLPFSHCIDVCCCVACMFHSLLAGNAKRNAGGFDYNMPALIDKNSVRLAVGSLAKYFQDHEQFLSSPSGQDCRLLLEEITNTLESYCENESSGSRLSNCTLQREWIELSESLLRHVCS
jgi:hypothetical protein